MAVEPRVRRQGWQLAQLLACLLALAGIWCGLSWQPDLSNRLRDDAYYEFVWAANLAAGHGPTVSDGVTTSGVQYLWSLLLVPLAWLAGPAALPLLAPWLGCLLHLATAGLWWQLGRRGRVARLLALGWLGNPLLLRECQNGQETALAGFLLSLLWLLRRRGAGLRCLLGCLAVLARADLYGCVLLLSLWRDRYRGLLGSLPPLLLWLLCNRSLGGGWLADSAAPMAFLWHTNFALTTPDTVQWLRQIWWYSRPVLLGSPFALGAAVGVAAGIGWLYRWLLPQWPRCLPLLLVAVAAVAGAGDLLVPLLAALVAGALPCRGARAAPWSLLLLLVGLAGILVLHWALRWYPRDYYAAPLAVFAVAALARLYRRPGWALPLLLAQAVAGYCLPPEPLAGQRELELAGSQLSQLLPPAARVGSFNSGILTFHAAVLPAQPAERRRVVNLDGVVDARSLRALQQRRLDHFLSIERIDWLLDHPRQFALDPRLPHASGHLFGSEFRPERDLQEVARFVALAAADPGSVLPLGDGLGCRLYWRAASGPVPAVVQLPRDLGAGAAGGRQLWWPAAAGQTLRVETHAGKRLPLLQVDCQTLVVLWLAPGLLGTGRLFVDEQTEPLLVLPPL